MAYIFPVNPFDGQLYPVPAVPGSLQYQWNASANVWLIYSPLGVQSVTGILPIVVQNPTDTAVVSINNATPSNSGAMSAADKAKLDNIPSNAGPGTVTQVGTGQGLLGGPITSQGTINLAPGTTNTIGGVIVGSNIDVAPSGLISIPTARFGVQSINVGDGLVGSPSTITSTGTITAALATRLSIGSVRVGNGLNVAPDGTISLGGSLGDVGVLAWGTVSVDGTGRVFTVKEGYNISSIQYAAGDQPRVEVYWQQPMANADYGVLLTARVPSYGGSASKNQTNTLINFSFKTVTSVDLLCASLYTQDNTTTTPFICKWNDWAGSLSEFDIVIIDTAVYS